MKTPLFYVGITIVPNCKQCKLKGSGVGRVLAEFAYKKNEKNVIKKNCLHLFVIKKPAGGSAAGGQ